MALLRAAHCADADGCERVMQAIDIEPAVPLGNSTPLLVDSVVFRISDGVFTNLSIPDVPLPLVALMHERGEVVVRPLRALDLYFQRYIISNVLSRLVDVEQVADANYDLFGQSTYELFPHIYGASEARVLSARDRDVALREGAHLIARPILLSELFSVECGLTMRPFHVGELAGYHVFTDSDEGVSYWLIFDSDGVLICSVAAKNMMNEVIRMMLSNCSLLQPDAIEKMKLQLEQDLSDVEVVPLGQMPGALKAAGLLMSVSPDADEGEIPEYQRHWSRLSKWIE